MTDAQFGVLTASFTVGGLAGSLAAGRYLNSGRKHAVLWHGCLLIAGSLLMTVANSMAVLTLGRHVFVLNLAI